MRKRLWLLSEGTQSYLWGSHQFAIHPLGVMLAWKKLHGCWPGWQELACILLHDVGIVGMQHRTGSKHGHWERGARWARRLFGGWGYIFCAGHTDEGGYARTRLFYADKSWWFHVPKWVLHFFHWTEGYGSLCTVDEWLARAKANIDAGFPKTGQAMFNDAKQEAEAR